LLEVVTPNYNQYSVRGDFVSFVPQFMKQVADLAARIRNPQTAYVVGLIGGFFMLVGSIVFDEVRYMEYLVFVNWIGASIWIIGFALYLYASNWTNNYTPDIFSILANFILLFQGVRYTLDMSKTVRMLRSYGYELRVSTNPSYIIIPLFALILSLFLISLKITGETTVEEQAGIVKKPSYKVQKVQREMIQTQEMDWDEIRLKAEIGILNKEELWSLVKRQLDELKLRMELGEITEEEYNREKEEIMQKLKEITQENKWG